MLWHTDRPPFLATETFNLCRSTVTNAGLAGRLAEIIPEIGAAEAQYLANTPDTLFQLAQSANVAGVSQQEMAWLYDKKLAAPGATARGIYDQIMKRAVDNVCPYCAHGKVRTLDHILPKKKYPALAVTPMNLVPSCRDCNTIKLSAAPTSYEEMVFHPYFEDITHELWLVAEVVEQNPCAAVFSVNPPAQWEEAKKNRLRNQFRNMKLDTLYSDQAAVEMSEIRDLMLKHYEAGGPDLVKSELWGIHLSRRAHRLNSWRAVLYKALSESDWYCAEGFRLLPTDAA